MLNQTCDSSHIQSETPAIALPNVWQALEIFALFSEYFCSYCTNFNDFVIEQKLPWSEFSLPPDLPSEDGAIERERFEKGAISKSGYWFSDFLQFGFILSTILYWIPISSCHYDQMSSTTQGELILFLKNQLQLGPKYIWKHFPLCRYKVPCQLLTGSC